MRRSIGAIRFAKVNLIYPELARSPLLLGSLTSDGVLQLASQGWSRALGWPVQELAGKHFIDFIDPEEAEQATALFQCQDGAKGHGHVSFALIGCDGTRRRFDWNSRLDDYDGITYILGAEKVPAMRTATGHWGRSLRYSASMMP